MSDEDKEESDMGIDDSSLEKKGKEEDTESPPDDKQNLVTASEEQTVEGEAEGKKSHLKMSEEQKDQQEMLKQITEIYSNDKKILGNTDLD